MGLWDYLGQPFAQHALLAGTLVAITSGLIGPFVVMRRMAFAVHGTAELSFTGAAAGLLVVGDPVVGALRGSLVVATAIGVLGARDRERDSAIGVILAFGLGVGVYLLSLYHGFATEATNILFGQIFGVSDTQLILLARRRAGRAHRHVRACTGHCCSRRSTPRWPRREVCACAWSGCSSSSCSR